MHRGMVAFLLSVVATGLLALSSTQALAQGPAQVGGKVEDGDGRPVKGLTIRFVPADGGAAREVTTRKNGRFAQRGLPPGKYILETADSESFFISTLEFQLKNSQGLTVGKGNMDGHPEKGAGPVPFSGRNELIFSLVVAGRESEQAEGKTLAFAATELNESVKQYEKGKFDRVVELTEAILADNPDLAEAHYMQGIALQGLGKHADAVPPLERAVERIPDHPGIWGVLGNSLLTHAEELAEGDDAETARAWHVRAADALTVAVERDPAATGLRVDLAKSLDAFDAHDRLIPVLEQILEEQPSNVQAQLRLASVYAGSGKYDQAVALAETIPTTVKRAAVTIYNIAVQLNDGGDTERSLWAARRAAEIDPELTHPQRLLVQLSIGSGDHPAAAQAIRRFLELAPDDPEAETYRRILAQIESP